MNMKSTLLISAGLLTSLAVLSLTGCNGANSADEPSGSSTLPLPTASIRVVESSGEMNADGNYSQNTTLTLDGSGVGSMGSGVSTCLIEQDFKISSNADFVAKDSIDSCNMYEFLMDTPGIYRYKLTVTDENALTASAQMFAFAVENNTQIYLDDDPRGLVEIIGATTDPDTNGYYFDDTTVTVRTIASGASGADVNCLVSLDHYDKATEEFEAVDNIQGSCSLTTDFNLTEETGTYRVRLVVSDRESGEQVAEDQKFLIAIPTELANSLYLNAEFDFTVSEEEDSLFQVLLDANNSAEGEGGDITNFSWEVFLKEEDSLNDNAVKIVTGQGRQTNVVVDRDGIYVARLTLTDESGETATTEKMFIVSGTGDTLIADFSVSIPSGAPVNILVDASASTIEAGIDHYEWELTAVGDDSGVNGEDRTVLYQLETESPTTVLPVAYSGIYFIRLTVIDASANEHEITRVITVPAA